jgi:hypothetical protein
LPIPRYNVLVKSGALTSVASQHVSRADAWRIAERIRAGGFQSSIVTDDGTARTLVGFDDELGAPSVP